MIKSISKDRPPFLNIPWQHIIFTEKSEMQKCNYSIDTLNGPMADSCER